MKYKYIIAFFLIGFIIQLFGGWAKLTHQSYAAKTLNVSFAIMIIAAVLALIKMLSTKNKDSFLNK
jgi:hypothetical protein